MGKEIEELFSYDLTQVDSSYRGWIEKFRREVSRIFNSSHVVRLDCLVSELIEKCGAGFDVGSEMRNSLSEYELYSFSDEDAKLLTIVIDTIKSFKGFQPIYASFNDWVMCSSEIAIKKDKAKQYKWIKCARCVTEQIRDCIAAFHKLEDRLYEEVMIKWVRLSKSEKWTVLAKYSDCEDTEYNEFAFFVSMGVGKLNSLDMNYPIISCSYVTNTHPYFYNQCNAGAIGWVFDLDVNKIVCMAPQDANSVCIQDKDCMLHSSFLAGIAIENDRVVSTSAVGLQALVTPEELERFPSHNEVILKGDAKPVGILVFAYEYNRDFTVKTTVDIISYLQDIPIFMYDELRNVIVRKSGIHKSVYEVAIEKATKMLRTTNVAVEDVAEYTGLPIEEVMRAEKEIRNGE